MWVRPSPGVGLTTASATGSVPPGRSMIWARRSRKISALSPCGSTAAASSARCGAACAVVQA